MIIYDEKLLFCSTFVLVLCMIKLMLSFIWIWNKLNASLIFCGGYDKNKTHSVIFMLSILDELKMICS
jgi:type IV secretory pathway ATPase VirB11/archaellum biosynthesis ATPase